MLNTHTFMYIQDVKIYAKCIDVHIQRNMHMLLLYLCTQKAVRKTKCHIDLYYAPT